MSLRILKKPQPKLDVLAFCDFIANDSLDAADRFLDAFDETVTKLAETPTLSSPWETKNPKNQHLRWWPVMGFPNHLIFFRCIDQGIEVIRVCHAAQDMTRIFPEK